MTQEEKIYLWEKVMGLEIDSGEIEDLFAEGKVCTQLWEQVYTREKKLTEGLSFNFSKEFEYITGYMTTICRYVSLRMFDYGYSLSEMKKEELWGQLMGYRPNNGDVEDMFEAGKRCAQLWELVHISQSRTEDVLGSFVREDLVYITDCMDEICKHVSMRMFDYGAEYAKQENL